MNAFVDEKKSFLYRLFVKMFILLWPYTGFEKMENLMIDTLGILDIHLHIKWKFTWEAVIMYIRSSVAKFKGHKLKMKLTREYLRHLYARVDNK